VHNPANRVFTTFVRDLRTPPADPPNGPPSLCYVRRPGRSAALLLSPPPSLGRHRGGPSARRVRVRSSVHLAPFPRGGPPCGQRVHVAHLARPGPPAGGARPHPLRRGPRGQTRVGADALRPAAERVRGDCPRPGRARGVRGRRARAGTRPAGGAGVQPAADVRPVRDRRLQPARARRRARGRRTAGAGLQPAVHLRPARAGQDTPAALDRQLRQRPRRRTDGPLHDRRGLHRPVRGRAARRRPGRLQGRLPRRRRPARRRRPVPAVQGQDRAGVLPHLQRPAPGRRTARADLRPPAARPRRASRPGWCATSARPSGPRG
jgi:hypothetical protein